MTKPSISGRRASLGLCALTAVLLLLAGCEADGRTGSLGVGTGAGALGGAAVVGLLGGSTAAMLGGAALGGIAGNMLVDRPADIQKEKGAEASRDRRYQRRLEYERQSQIQEEQVRQEIEEQRLFEQWKSERGQ